MEPQPTGPAEPPARPVGPAARLGTAVDGVEVLAALSPSRADDFLSCPQLYKFRAVDRRPEPSSAAALRGTLVHRVLELLFDSPADERTPEHALTLVEPAWVELREREPDAVAEAVPDPEAFLVQCRDVVGRWFELEDPTRLEPADRELYVEALLESRLLLRGFVDRVDESPDGSLRVVDYKTSSSPGERYEARALFQLRFYALALWRTRGVVPAMLQLVYLGNREMLRYEPDEADLLATERKVEAVWRAIRYAEQSGEWRPQTSGRCSWCSFKPICPAWGGTPPPLPADAEPVSRRA